MVKKEKEICPYCHTIGDNKVLDEYIQGYDYIYKLRCLTCRCKYMSIYKLKFKKNMIMKKGDFKRDKSGVIYDQK